MTTDRLSSLLAANPHLDRRDLAAVRAAVSAGTCVAFVGAGFAAGATPLWADLLTTLADRHADQLGDTAETVRRLVAGTPSTLALEAAAQILEDGLAGLPGGFRAAVAAAVGDGEGRSLAHRKRVLADIPFRAVLTTNFDGNPDGEPPSPQVYRRILRPDETRRWWTDRFRTGSSPVVTLHGRLADESTPITLTRRDYRTLLYRDPSYLAFLFALFSTTTVLFLGKSFDDAYLNELRSQILATLEPDRAGGEPLAYTTAPWWEVSADEAEFLRRHDGVAVLRYGAEAGDHAGFDQILGWLATETNFYHRFARVLDGRRLLWVDANDPDSWQASDVAATIARIRDTGADVEIVQVSDPEAAASHLADTPWDLVVTHWGHRPDGESNAVRLLRQIRHDEVEVPVIVFTEPNDFADANRRRALGLGALAYTVTYDTLFETMFETLAPAEESW